MTVEEFLELHNWGADLLHEVAELLVSKDIVIEDDGLYEAAANYLMWKNELEVNLRRIGYELGTGPGWDDF